MHIKLLADKYIEVNIQRIYEINSEVKNKRDINDEYILIFCRNGKMNISIGKIDYTLNDGDIFLIPEKMNYHIKFGLFSCLAISFGGVSIDEILICTEFNDRKLLIHDSDSRIGYYFYKIYHAYHETESLNIKCLGLFYELLYELTKNFQHVNHALNSQERHIEIAKEFINYSYSQEITIADVAKKVGVTSNYLANIFAVYEKKSPKIYLTQVRMEQAKKMLATHKYKIKDVGKFVGYKNQLHFSSEFKKYTGKSPLQYVKDLKI